jgi:hypothetical protein
MIGRFSSVVLGYPGVGILFLCDHYAAFSPFSFGNSGLVYDGISLETGAKENDGGRLH